MIRNRSLTDNRSSGLIATLAVALGLIAFAMTVRFASLRPAASGAAPGISNPAAARAAEAYTARLAGLAETYAPAAAAEAYADRSAGMVAMPTRSEIAYGERWSGLAATYAPANAEAARWQGLADTYRQRAIQAYAARWTGLAAIYTAK